MLNNDERLDHDLGLTAHLPRPSATDGMLGAIRAVSLVVLGLSSFAMAGFGLYFLLAGEFIGILTMLVGVAIAAGVILVIALVVAIPLGALLARANAVMAAMLVAPIAGFLVPLALFRDVEFAGVCGAISILVGVLYATDTRFLPDE